MSAKSASEKKAQPQLFFVLHLYPSAVPFYAVRVPFGYHKAKRKRASALFPA